jgi:hypothetical protein
MPAPYGRGRHLLFDEMAAPFHRGRCGGFSHADEALESQWLLSRPAACKV